MEVEEQVVSATTREPIVLSLKDLDEEIHLEDGDADKAAQAEAEIRAYDALIRKFTGDSARWTPENIGQRMAEFSTALQELDSYSNQPMGVGYVGLKVMPYIAGAMVNILNNYLPEAHRLMSTCVDQFVVDTARLLDSKRYTDTHMRLINFTDLLDPETAAQLYQPVSDETAAWLSAEAERRLGFVLAEARVQLPSMPNPEKYKLHRLVQHLSDVMQGRLAAGFNVRDETRWEICSHEFLLNAKLGDLRVTDKSLSEKQVTYLLRLAGELLGDLEDHRQEAADEFNASEELKQQYQWLKTIVDTETLPYGYYREKLEAMDTTTADAVYVAVAADKPSDNTPVAE